MNTNEKKEFKKLVDWILKGDWKDMDSFNPFLKEDFITKKAEEYAELLNTVETYDQLKESGFSWEGPGDDLTKLPSSKTETYRYMVPQLYSGDVENAVLTLCLLNPGVSSKDQEKSAIEEFEMFKKEGKINAEVIKKFSFNKKNMVYRELFKDKYYYGKEISGNKDLNECYYTKKYFAPLFVPDKDEDFWKTAKEIISSYDSKDLEIKTDELKIANLDLTPYRSKNYSASKLLVESQASTRFVIALIIKKILEHQLVNEGSETQPWFVIRSFENGMKGNWEKSIEAFLALEVDNEVTVQSVILRELGIKKSDETTDSKDLMDLIKQYILPFSSQSASVSKNNLTSYNANKAKFEKIYTLDKSLTDDQKEQNEKVKGTYPTLCTKANFFEKSKN
ncbi:hypothetical protein [Enterococcus sp.]|uniref:hypothetical protein n=1 Tax=Enterococcus sp. TaxID=35783 RepID=UPI003C73C42C